MLDRDLSAPRGPSAAERTTAPAVLYESRDAWDALQIGVVAGLEALQ